MARQRSDVNGLKPGSGRPNHNWLSTTKLQRSSCASSPAQTQCGYLGSRLTSTCAQAMGNGVGEGPCRSPSPLTAPSSAARPSHRTRAPMSPCRRHREDRRGAGRGGWYVSAAHCSRLPTWVGRKVVARGRRDAVQLSHSEQDLRGHDREGRDGRRRKKKTRPSS